MTGSTMAKTIERPRTKVKPKTERPKLWKVILLNDDYTPREFVVQVLKAVFRMNESQAYRVMMTAHQRGAGVIAGFTRDVAETKAKEATDLGKQAGYPLFFNTEPEEQGASSTLLHTRAGEVGRYNNSGRSTASGQYRGSAGPAIGRIDPRRRWS